MTDEAKAAHAAYMREWRRKNKDKVKTGNEKYWAKKAAELAAEAEKEAAENKDQYQR